MLKNLVFILILLIHHAVFSQEGKIIQNKATLFQLESPADTIEFIVVDTQLNKTKPVFLWCQGSLPQPLFGEIEGKGYFFQGGGIANFDYQSIIEQFHLVVISMPHTPVEVSKENLNSRFLYVPDLSQPNVLLKSFVQADYLENYVNRANQVLSFLSTKDWVNKDEVIVAGVSQGSKVATKIAVSNPSVTKLGLFSPNPFGRIDQYVRQARLDAQFGKISWEKADSLMQQSYDFLRKANHPDSIKKNPSLRNWQSFSEPIHDDWLSLYLPIYLAYGTEDRTADLCDIVPLFFIGAGKDNLTLKRYLHLEHNFFEVEKDGQVNYEKEHWNEVMMEFLKWINTK